MTPVQSSTAFDGQVALVTGASGAIGMAVSQALHAQGAAVVMADCVAPAALPGPRCRSVSLDVRDRSQVHAVVAEVLAREGRLDVLVNVAGVVSFGSAEHLAEAEWDRVIDINLKGCFLCCQAVMPLMRAQRRGRIVNIGSLVGKNAGNARPWISPAEQDRSSNVAYGVSKAGVHMLTGFLAKELAAHGIMVNAVAPGPVATAMTTAFPESLKALIPLGRMVALQDVAQTVCFLASPTNTSITGEILDVNAGMWCD